MNTDRAGGAKKEGSPPESECAKDPAWHNDTASTAPDSAEGWVVRSMLQTGQRLGKEV